MSEQTKKAGRPRKEIPAETKQAEEVKPIVKLPDVALGLSKLPTGERVLVRIGYNAVSGETGRPTLEVLKGDMLDAEDYYTNTVFDEVFKE